MCVCILYRGDIIGPRCRDRIIRSAPVDALAEGCFITDSLQSWGKCRGVVYLNLIFELSVAIAFLVSSGLLDYMM